MSHHAIVIKQQGHREAEHFDRDKLFASVAAACRSVSLSEGIALDTAHHACQAVELWLSQKTTVTSDDIRRVATNTLAIVSPEAGYLYKHHETLL